MDAERYARKQIDEAIVSGELTPTVGVGMPIEDLAEARAQIDALNRGLEHWNETAPAGFSIDPISEIWPITERAKEPGS